MTRKEAKEYANNYTEVIGALDNLLDIVYDNDDSDSRICKNCKFADEDAYCENEEIKRRLSNNGEMRLMKFGDTFGCNKWVGE